ncbi:MAG TPA: roadblock/LC7 domain-containing protein [Candidatus Sulfotelmatobacter sp.]|nr:roadblock/LC7 domain-containing protein [Candidatus Sulfotelmatobacter sp.]
MANDFQGELQGLVDRVPGGRAAVLADPDGIALATAVRDPGLDADVVAARYAVVLRELRGALERLGHGEPTQVILELQGAKIAILPLKECFGLYLVLEPGQDLGRGLFEARKTATALERAL